MKLVKVSERLTQLKEGNKIVFEVITNRNKTKYHSFKRGLGIVNDCESFDECVEKTFERIGMINEDFLNRLVSL